MLRDDGASGASVFKGFHGVFTGHLEVCKVQMCKMQRAKFAMVSVQDNVETDNNGLSRFRLRFVLVVVV